MSLQRLWGVWVGEEGRPRRRSTSPPPACESLEGRQLLSAAGLYRGGLGSSLSQRAYPAQFAPGGPNSDFQQVNVAGQDVVQARQGLAHGRRLHAAGGGLGSGALGMKNAGRMARFQTWPANAPGGTSQAVTAAPNGTAPAVTTPPITVAPGQDAIASATTAVVPVGAGAGAGAGAAWSDGWDVPDVVSNDTPATDDAVTKAFDKLDGDLQAIHDKSEVTPKLLAAVRDDLKALTAAATTNVGADALKTFKTDVQNLDGQLPTDAQRDQLVADFNALVKSRGITDQGLIDKTVADVQAVAQATHITADDLATIAADRKAIATATGADANDATAVKFTHFGAPTDILLAGLTGGNLSGVPMGGVGGPFTFAMNGAPFGGPMGGSKFSFAPGNVQFDGPMGGGAGSFQVMAKAMPFGGSMGAGKFMVSTAGSPMMGGGQMQMSTYGGPAGGGSSGGPWVY